VITLQTNRADLRQTRVIKAESAALESGQIRVEIDKFALTANNVSYAVTGDMIGYWRFYPVDDSWGIVPVWGLGHVVESATDEIAVGEQLYGFFPMASEVVLTPSRIKDTGFADATPHRQELPPLYNQYMRTADEPEFLKALEDERCLYFPLFITSFVIADLLKAENYFGADQVIIGSVSSKTGLGTAFFLQADENYSGKIIGLTSATNKNFVEGLGCCTDVLAYGEEQQIEATQNAVFVDMAGNGPLRKVLHTHLGERMKSSQLVGATHWESDRSRDNLPGARPELFFAPAQIARRDAEWGRGVLMKKGYAASAELAAKLKGQIDIKHLSGSDAITTAWLDMLNNSITPNTGIMARLT